MIKDVKKPYFRPLPDRTARPGALRLGQTGPWFSQVQILDRNGGAQILPHQAIASLWPEGADALARITMPRTVPWGGQATWPMVMGIVNVTPDSFSDGGKLQSAGAAIEHALSLAEQGADILDIGGESTRPGAKKVSEAEELDRVLPVIEGLMAANCPVPVSIDTRKARVAKAAISAGARLFNDVSALSFDTGSIAVARSAQAVCLMHAQGDPETMQANPVYDNVVLDVFDYLERRVAVAEEAGIPRERQIVDPGIGFGKNARAQSFDFATFVTFSDHGMRIDAWCVT